jgi:fermentation-respiration switch protein FrsA (DUF1100 family)
MLLTFFALLILITLGIGYAFAARVIFPKCFGVQETYEIEKEKGRLQEAEFLSWPREEVLIPSDFGYSIYGLYFPNAGSRRTLILSHGVTYTLFGSVKYMPIFRELGFNLFLYDLRYHGRSGGRNATFGLYEKQDLVRIVDWVLARCGPETLVGTHGESLGAAISLQHAALDARVAFVIEDCGFSDLPSLLAYRLKQDYGLGSFPLLPLSSFISRMLSGMRFTQISPLRTMPEVSAPVLFIHGAEDTYIPPQMAEELYRAQGHEKSRLYLAPQAGHAQAWSSNPAAYAEQVKTFLLENMFI